MSFLALFSINNPHKNMVDILKIQIITMFVRYISWPQLGMQAQIQLLEAATDIGEFTITV